MKTWKDLYEQLDGEHQKQRSCWEKGVFEIATIIVDRVICNNGYEGSPLPKLWAEAEVILLRGASDWTQYIQGGSALISDKRIAHTLLTPSQLKRWYSSPSDYVPGHVKTRMTMIDLEICAARQAVQRIRKAYQELKVL